MLKITGIVLAGGQGRRMAGQVSKTHQDASNSAGTDKGLVTFLHQPMISHALTRLKPQVSELLINANQHTAEYSAFGYPVIQDSLKGFAGPLAGLQAGMQAARFSHVLTVPCDSPFLPHDLAERLSQALISQHADIAVAKTGAQVHPVFCLCDKKMLPQLTQYLEDGGRKFDTWYQALNAIEVTFDDQAHAFSNINTPEELAALEAAHQSPVKPSKALS